MWNSAGKCLPTSLANWGKKTFYGQSTRPTFCPVIEWLSITLRRTQKRGDVLRKRKWWEVRPQWSRVRHDTRERWTVHTLRVTKRSWATREKILRVQSARGAVWCLHAPSLTKTRYYLRAKYLKKKCAHHSCHPALDVQDDAHHIQPVSGSTDHATNCSARFVAWSHFSAAAWAVVGSLCCWMVAIGVVGLEDRVEWWDRIGVQPRPLPPALPHELFVLLQESQLVTALVQQVPWLFKLITHSISYLSHSCRVAIYEWSSCARSSKPLQNPSVHPMCVCKPRQISNVWKRSRTASSPSLIAFSERSFAW